MKAQETTREHRPDLLREDLLWPAPKVSDAEFLVSLRGRLSRPVVGIWLTSRKLGIAFGLAAILLVGVWYPAQESRVQFAEQAATLDESVAEFVNEDADPADLADYLGVVADYATESDDQSDFLVASLSTSELLELDQQDLDLILDELEKTEFF